jgi:hypothetical protein
VQSIAIENLPAYEQISSEPIRESAARFDAARSAREQARKDLIELEQTREAAEWADAEAAEKARAEGKAEPKRSHVAVHDKKTDEVRHELKVATLAETRARDVLQAAIGEHGGAWAGEVGESVEALSAEWADTVEGLIALHGRLTAALSVARVVGIGTVPRIRALPFRRRQIENAEFASPQQDVPAYVPTGDVLAALASVIEPEPDVEKTPVQHPPRRGEGSNLLRGRGDVENEIAERRAFDEHARSPEGMAERERVVARRRQRAERNRQEREQALAESLAG